MIAGCLAQAHEYIALDISKLSFGYPVVFYQLENSPESAVHQAAAKLLNILASNSDFITQAVKSTPQVIWRLLRTGKAAKIHLVVSRCVFVY